MITEDYILDLIYESIENLDCYLVDLSVSPLGQIKVEMDSDDGAKVKDCMYISRLIENDLESFENLNVSIQVTTPGLGQAIKVKRQYRKNINRYIKVRVGALGSLPNENQYLTGKLLSVDDDKIEIKINNKIKQILFENIRQTKTVISFK